MWIIRVTLNISMIHSSEGPAETTLIDCVHPTQVQAGLPQSLCPKSLQRYMLAIHTFAVSLSETGSQNIGF
jgi:hypothetical protein